MNSTTQDHINDVMQKSTGESIATVDFKGKTKKRLTALDPSVNGNFHCLNTAIDFFGTIAELSRALDVSPPNVHYWKTHTGLIPTDRALRIHELTDGLISMESVLRENEAIRLANKTTY